jgi:tRNA1Val (adenine37-N6)-methyltransferase
MRNNWFQFKQFRIIQEKSALKVGTDAVLLGAWCDVSGAKRIMDVGSGTGVIALMLAQRSLAIIDAVEINDDACIEARINFQNSPWKDRLSLYSADFNHFSQTCILKYDLIVSNPPYFRQSLRSSNHAASMAKHDVSLSFLQLLTGSKQLLSENGRLAVIIPAEAFDDFREAARLVGFYLARKTRVIPKIGKLHKRVLLEFSISQVYPVEDELVILVGKDKYSDQYIELAKDFYLNMG